MNLDICLIVEFLISDTSDGEKVESKREDNAFFDSLQKFSQAIKGTCKQAIFRKVTKKSQ